MSRHVMVIAGALLLAACATPEPSLQTGPGAETTFDGLVRVNNSAFERAWVDPTIDISGYSKIMPAAARFEYRAVRDTSGVAARRSSATEFPISDQGKQRLQADADEIFREELAKSRYFTLVTEPGPDVLIIRGAMLDIVSRVPPDIVGRGEIFIDRVGEATLVLQLVDSMSGETLGRAAERGAAEAAGSMGTRSSSVTARAESRRLFRRWAVKLREGLDAFHEASLARQRAEGG